VTTVMPLSVTKITRAVGFGVIADGGSFGEMHVAIDDAAADAAVPSHGDVGEQDGGVNVRIGVHSDVGRKDGIFDRAAGDNATVGHNGIERGAHTVFLAKTNFAGGYWRWWVRMGHS